MVADPSPAGQSQSNGSQAVLLQQQPVPGPSPLPQQLQQHPLMPKSPMPNQQPMFPPGVKVPQVEQQQQSTGTVAQQQQAASTQRPASATQPVPLHRSNVPAAFPGSLSDLVVSFENVKQKGKPLSSISTPKNDSCELALRANNLSQVHKMLDGGYSSVPQPQDTEKPKYYVPRNPFQTPAYYPQTPHTLLSTPGIFAQLDVETLFWVFYYLPGTYQQQAFFSKVSRMLAHAFRVQVFSSKGIETSVVAFSC